MNFLDGLLLRAVIAVAGLMWVADAHAILSLIGRVAYNYSGNQVTLEAERIENTSSNTISGTVHLQLWATTTPTIDTFYRLADANLSLLSNQFPEGNGRIPPGGAFTNVVFNTTFTPPPNGTYYLHMVVTQFDSGQANSGLNTPLDSVTFSSTQTFGNPSSDDHGDTPGTSTAISSNALVSGNLEVSGDLDVFRVILSQSGRLTATTSGSTDTVGRLLRSNGSLIRENDDGGSGLNFFIDESLSAGTYYIEVRGFATTTGPYQLSTAFVADLGPLVSFPDGLTGIFYDPSRNGSGFNLIYGNNGLTFFFYGHDSLGERLWLISDTLTVTPRYGNAIEGRLYEVVNGTFGNPDPGSLLDWGRFEVVFISCDAATFYLEGGDGAVLFDTIRLDRVAGSGCG